MSETKAALLWVVYAVVAFLLILVAPNAVVAFVLAGAALSAFVFVRWWESRD